MNLLETFRDLPERIAQTFFQCVLQFFTDRFAHQIQLAGVISADLFELRVDDLTDFFHLSVITAGHEGYLDRPFPTVVFGENRRILSAHPLFPFFRIGLAFALRRAAAPSHRAGSGRLFPACHGALGRFFPVRHAAPGPARLRLTSHSWHTMITASAAMMI